MELEDFKNNWAALNKSVDKHAVFDEQIIRRIIVEKAVKAQEKLVSNELFLAFLGAGTGVITLLLSIVRHTILSWPDIILITVIFMLIPWQLTKARFLNRTSLIETDTVHYLRRINRYAQWIHVELRTGPILTALLLACCFWAEPVPLNLTTVLIILFLFLFVCTFTLFSTQKTYLRHIKKIREEMKELEEMEQSSQET